MIAPHLLSKPYGIKFKRNKVKQKKKFYIKNGKLATTTLKITKKYIYTKNSVFLNNGQYLFVSTSKKLTIKKYIKYLKTLYSLTFEQSKSTLSLLKTLQRKINKYIKMMENL